MPNPSSISRLLEVEAVTILLEAEGLLEAKAVTDVQNRDDLPE